MARTCEVCHGTGFEVHETEAGVLTSVRCACKQVDPLVRLETIAKIPQRYAHCSLDQTDQRGEFRCHTESQKKALRLCREWVEGFPGTAEDPDVFLIGPPGCGKTHLVVAAARQLMRLKQVEVLFFEQRALLKALQGTFGSGSGPQESEVIKPVMDCELLVLDDLGAGRTSEWAKDVLHDVISHRYNERKHMLVTTNVPLGDGADRRRSRGDDSPLTLTDRLGGALISRLREMCRMVEITGPDARKDVTSQQY